MGPRTWFDADKLLPGERLVRTGPARLQIAAPPHWWDGHLILTTDRLFFLPHVESPLVHDAAFWLDDVVQAARAGRNRLFVFAHSGDVTLELSSTGLGIAGLLGRREAGWGSAIMRLQRVARPRSQPQLEGTRRAAG
jgi:hypothetical protein